jgi:hypothetical protein
MDAPATPPIPDIERLLFRRQFLIASTSYAPNEYWRVMELTYGLKLSVHCDLEVCIRHKGQTCLVGLGILLDPLHPQRSTDEILDTLLATDVAHSEDGGSESLFENSKYLSGRWILINIQPDSIRLFTDPCGFRTLFYTTAHSQLYCASQPELLKALLPLQLSTDASKLEFMHSTLLEKNEYAWVGTETIYDFCYHLLPNHFLEYRTAKQVRYYPTKPLEPIDTAFLVEQATRLLQGTLEALVSRYTLALPITAGIDSRVLLAASKTHKKNIHYFVHQHGDMSASHADIVVPSTITKRLEIEFCVQQPNDEVPGWFYEQLDRNVTTARHGKKTDNIYHHFCSLEQRVNVNGNGSEICRNQFNRYGRKLVDKQSNEDLASGLYGKGNLPTFVLTELQKWRNDLGELDKTGFTLLDFLYWEQRLGNWGAQFPSEQDIAIDEVSPFNNRALLELLIRAPRKERQAPLFTLYLKLIKGMWPELLEYPVNPHFYTRYGSFKQKLRKAVPTKAEVKLRQFLKK